MRKIFTSKRRGVLLLVFLLLCSIQHVLADNGGLVDRQITINVEKAGLLSSKIGSSKKYRLTNLKITGYLNINDIAFIREMAGCYYDNNYSRYDGHLQILDLSEASLVGNAELTIDVSNGDETYQTSLADGRKISFLLFGCLPSLQEISLPEDITSIGTYSFYLCENLRSIKIPLGVVAIGEGAFANCFCLASFTVPEGVKELGYATFALCLSLQSIDLPSSLKYIGDAAFLCCSSLQSLHIPKGVTSIGIQAFQDCAGLESLELPSGITNIGQLTFAECTNLTSLNIPTSITSIGSQAFENCRSWRDGITIPSGVKYIGDHAFAGCSSLRYINACMKAPVMVSNDTFEGVNKYCILYVPKGTEDSYFLMDGWGEFSNIYGFNPAELYRVVNVKEAGTLCNRIDGGWKNDIENLTVSGVLNDADFQYLRNLMAEGKLQNLNMENVNLKNLSGGAFKNCTNLKKITLPANLKNIGDGAFLNCRGLSSLNIPSGVTSIGSYAFNQCQGLTSISLPSSLLSIGEQAFANCIGLTSVYAYMNIPMSCSQYDLMCGGFFGSADRENCTLYVPQGSLLAYRNTLGWSEMKNIVEMDFSDSDLVSLTIRDVKMIPNDLKYTVNKLTVTGPMDSYDFQILRDMSQNGQLEYVDLTDAPVEELGYEAFAGCTNLKRILLPRTLKVIGEAAFYMCSSLTSLVIPEGVEELPEYVFYESGLITLTLPASLKRINNGGKFAGYVLKAIYAYMPEPIAAGEAFDYTVSMDGCILYVPKGTAEAYRNSYPWSKFKHVVEMDAAGIGSVLTDSIKKESSRYSADGKRLKAPRKGLNIVKYGDGSVRKVIVP